MKLNDWLKKSRISRKALADILNVSQSMISQVISGKRLFHPSIALRLIDFSGGSVTYDDLYGKPKKKGKAA
jgi:plasmid maintenance system antidote protein VapI